jgi:hypothetical protein
MAEMDDKPEAIQSFALRKASLAIFGTAITVFFQIAASIALYGARATAKGNSPWQSILSNDLLVLWLPAIVSAIIIGAIFSLVLRQYKPGAYIVAVVVSGVTWIIALTIAINKFGA